MNKKKYREHINSLVQFESHNVITTHHTCEYMCMIHIYISNIHSHIHEIMQKTNETFSMHTA